MPAPSQLEHLSPSDLVEAATTRTLTSFLALHGGAPFLLVRIGGGDAELAVGFGTTRGGPGSSVAEPMQFHTVVHMREKVPVAAPGVGPEDSAALVTLLRQAHHFALPLRKREDMDSVSSDRISVGRARNKDLVFRHVSVSKFHAWFQSEPSGEFTLTDAGSKNLTRVNGDALLPREAKVIVPGDKIRFGSVACVVCSPETLWTVVRSLNGGAR